MTTPTMRRFLRWVAVAVVAAVAAAGCTEADFEFRASGTPGDGGPGSPSQPGDPEIGAPMTPSDGGRGDEQPDPADVVDAALLDVEDFWERTYEDVYGEPYVPIQGGFFPYGPGTEIPPCGSPGDLTYEDIAANAFYCPQDDLIAWDEVNLLPQLQEDFGPFTVGIVMAHEFGHAIQARADVRGPTIVLELQADCFAGAWTADVADGNARFFAVTGGDLDASLAGFITIRDQVGTSARNPNAHGSGFDRISAFQDGFENGPEACRQYDRQPPEVVQIPFSSREDLANEGNLPLNELLPLLIANLEVFYTELFAAGGETWDPVDDIEPVDPVDDTVSCGDETFTGPDLEFAGFYCAADDRIYLDATNLVPALDDIGDFAFGAEVARLYAVSAQVQAGTGGSELDQNLGADCLAGAFSGALFERTIDTGDADGDGFEDAGLLLSPGDLDEAIIAFLQFGGDEELEERTGSAFERTAAFREGFFDGPDACALF